MAPQLQVIVCGEESLRLQRVSTTEVQLPPLPDAAVLQLLVSAAPKVQRLLLSSPSLMPSYACIWFCTKMLGGRTGCELRLRSCFLQESSMETLRSIASACTACPLLLQLCSRVLQQGLQTPTEVLVCLQSPPDELGVLIR